ncbi:MAG: tetratricopeptide repeat protein [Bacteroidota bacterium]
MRTAFVFMLLIIAAFTAWAQDFKTDFVKSFNAKDTSAQREILEKWEAEDANDPELYTSYFNYYFGKSKQSMLILENTPQGEKSLGIQDSTGKTVGYINGGTFFDPADFGKAIAIIDTGIKLFPTRLDMRFGKTHVLGQKGDWNAYTAEIVRSIEGHFEDSLVWTWTEGKLVEDRDDFFLSSIQDYQYDLYQTGEDSLLPKMAEIAEKILSYQPDHVESLSNLSITYLLTDQFDKALVPLLQAEEIRPTDAIVLSNIAQAYLLLEDKENAIIYYQKVAEHGDKDLVEFAEARIKELSTEYPDSYRE